MDSNTNKSDEELLAWLALLRAPQTGCQTLNPLLLQQPDPRQLISTPPDDTPDKLRRYLRKPDWQQAERDLQWLKQPRNRLLAITDPEYPVLLRSIPDPPTALFLHGRLDSLDLPQLAIVGSRNPSHGGRTNAREFARFLAAAGLAITSGMALGIDSAAHLGALHGNGITLAVTGTGLDRVYPAKNRDLAYKIAEKGLLISEFGPGTPPLPGNFPRRNRIISGLSVGTLVVEAALKSGSLITARLASEQGREVFAIPGSIHNPLARGCHALIRQGAKLVETGEHVAEELSAMLGGLDQQISTEYTDTGSDFEIDDEHRQLLDAMGYDPATTDQLVSRTGFSAASVSSMLLLLELQGHVSSEAGGLFTRPGLENSTS